MTRCACVSALMVLPNTGALEEVRATRALGDVGEEIWGYPDWFKELNKDSEVRVFGKTNYHLVKEVTPSQGGFCSKQNWSIT